MFRDVTAREIDSERLRAALVEAQAADRAKSMFLATMSHEICTPLNGIVGMAALLEDEDLPEAAAERIRSLRYSSELLQALVGDVLDYSKAQAGELVLENAPFDLGQIIRDTRETLEPSAIEQGLHLSISYAAQCPRHFVGDALRIRQVLLNLVPNAIKFTKQGGVEISVEELEHGVDSARVRIRVADTGIGIADDRLESIFSVFAQADAATAASYGGSGLGLAIVRQLVDAMGASISVASRPDLGSTFSLELCLPTCSAVTPAEEAAAVTGCLSLRVLIAEDDPINQIVSRAMVESLGCTVHVVADGAEAVASAESGEFDVVLMGCRMPGVDGYQATRQIRQLRGAAANVPIVALTANSTAEDRALCFAAGMQGYVTKPTQPNALRVALMEAVQDSSAAAPAR